MKLLAVLWINASKGKNVLCIPRNRWTGRFQGPSCDFSVIAGAFLPGSLGVMFEPHGQSRSSGGGYDESIETKLGPGCWVVGGREAFMKALHFFARGLEPEGPTKFKLMLVQGECNIQCNDAFTLENAAGKMKDEGPANAKIVDVRMVT